MLSQPLPEPEAPKDIKTQVQEKSTEFAKDHYEGFLRSLMNFIFTILNFLKNSILNIINQVLSRD